MARKREGSQDRFWAYGRERLREPTEEEKPLTLQELEAQYAASQAPEERTRLKDLIESIKDELAGEAAPPDERLF